MSLSLFREHMPHVFSLISNPNPGAPNSITPELEAVLDASYLYSRMLHKSYSPGGALEGSGFYRSFVCQVGSPLDPTQLGKLLPFREGNLFPRPDLVPLTRAHQEVLPDGTRQVLSLPLLSDSPIPLKEGMGR
jgi:hypothetical protein